MNISSTAVGKEFKHELSRLTGTAFQKKCYDYLLEFIVDLRYAAELKKVDRYGIDIYNLSDKEKENFNLAIQCKGFEERFEQSQYDQCISSLDTLRNSGKKANEYYMVLNLQGLHINQDLRTKLDLEVKSLVKDGVCKTAELLSIEGFEKFLALQIIRQLTKKIKIASKRFNQDFVKSMSQKFYFESVPYQLNNKKGINPTQAIKNKLIDPTTGQVKSTKKRWVFIISEFGFGKTSLLFNLMKEFEQSTASILFIPVALFSKVDFYNMSSFCPRILEIIEGEKIDFSLTINKIKAKLLAYLLQYNDNNVLLMIDGLDEQDQLFNLNILNAFFNNISVFRCPIIFTLRKEFWDERNGNFITAIGKRRQNNKPQILLEEWQNEHIVAYLDEFMLSTSLKDNALKDILSFKQLILEDQYETYYGDIPRRPLFLEMLINDILVNKIKKRTISEIYLSYLRSKFLIDRKGSFDSHYAKRPLSLNEDVNKTMSFIFSILNRVAAKMVIGADKDNNMIVSSFVEEKVVEGIIKDLGIPQTVELMLNSVLIPSGIRVNDNMSLKFAHKSFQEFFFARSIFNHAMHCFKTNTLISDLNYVHSDGVGQFLIGLLTTEISKRELVALKKRIAQDYIDYHPHTLTDLILNKTS